MAKLHELQEEFLMLQQVLDECTDEESKGHIASAITVTVENAEKVIGHLIEVQKNYEAEQAMFEEAKKKFAAKENAAEVRAKNLKAFVTEQLVRLGYTGDNGKKLKAGLYTTFMQNSKSSLIVEPTAVIPDMYYIQPATIVPDKVLDKDLLMGAVSSGLFTFEGVSIRKNQSIRIK